MTMARQLAEEWKALATPTGKNAEKLALKILMYLNARVCTWEEFVCELEEERK